MSKLQLSNMLSHFPTLEKSILKKTQVQLRHLLLQLRAETVSFLPGTTRPIRIPFESRLCISIYIFNFLLDFSVDFAALCVCVFVCVRRLFVSIKLIDAHFSNLTKRSEKSISDKTFADCLAAAHTPPGHF